MPGFAIPRITPSHHEIGQIPSIGQQAGIGQGTLDEQIQQASRKCVNGDQAACNQWIQLTSLKGQMTAAGNLQAGGTPIGDILNPASTSSPYSFGTATTGTAQWAYPFDPKFFNAKYLTEKFGETAGEWGNDYGLPSGTPIYSPFEGTVIGVENNGDTQWGTRIFVQGPDGTIFAVGHVRQGSTLGIGTKVKPGQQIALSGGGIGTNGQPNDPGHGNSTGQHVEIQVIKPGGNIYNRADYINSQPWLQNVFSGTPASLGMPDGYYTIDGHFIENGSPDDVVYKMAQSIWHKEYGTDPPYSIVQAMRLSGAKTIDDLQAMVNAMPSSIPGVNIGTYNGVNANLQKIGTASFGRPMSQALLRQFLAENITTPEQMQAYFDSHPASQIPQDTFQAAYDIANQTTQGIWGASPTLDQVAAIAGTVGPPPPKKQRDPNERQTRGPQ
jgi:Peptidase family M23